MAESKKYVESAVKLMQVVLTDDELKFVRIEVDNLQDVWKDLAKRCDFILPYLECNVLFLSDYWPANHELVSTLSNTYYWADLGYSETESKPAMTAADKIEEVRTVR